MKGAEILLFLYVFVLSSTKSDYLSILNLARSCIKGPCIVVQSTYLTDGYACNESNAVDDDISVNNDICTCPGGRLCYDRDPWVQIDLEESKYVFAGRIWDWQSSFSESRESSALDRFKIWIGNHTPYNATGNINCYTATTIQHLIYPYIHSFLCRGTGRFVFFQPTSVIRPNNNPTARFAEIQLYPAMPNIARACERGQCPVSQSNLLKTSKLCSPSHANDGDFDSVVCTCPSGHSCADADPWLRIDLEQTTSIFAGVITDRPSSGASRTDNFSVWVGNNGTIYNGLGNTRYGALPHLSRPGLVPPLFLGHMKTIHPGSPGGVNDCDGPVNHVHLWIS